MKTHLKHVITSGFLFVTILIVSCSKKENNQSLFTNKDDKAIAALKKNYGLNIFGEQANYSTPQKSDR